MEELRNVECTRCGNAWYSKSFARDGELPEKCVHCYRDSVREIPPPPTILDRLGDRLAKLREEVPRRAAELHHRAVLWKENNKLMISMVGTGVFILLIISGLMYVLFFR